MGRYAEPSCWHLPLIARSPYSGKCWLDGIRQRVAVHHPIELASWIGTEQALSGCRRLCKNNCGGRSEESADDKENSKSCVVRCCHIRCSGQISCRIGSHQFRHGGGAPKADWKKIGDFCAIQIWHPSVSKCEQTDEAGTTYRTLTATDGGTIKEKLVEQTDTSYTYEIIESPLPVDNYRATISVSADGDATRVDWKGSFDAKGQSDAEAETVIREIYEAGLKQIAKVGGN